MLQTFLRRLEPLAAQIEFYSGVLVILRLLPVLEWRNWQTHGTQNPAFFTEHVGSTPTSSTNAYVRQPLPASRLSTAQCPSCWKRQRSHWRSRCSANVHGSSDEQELINSIPG